MRPNSFSPLCALGLLFVSACSDPAPPADEKKPSASDSGRSTSPEGMVLIPGGSYFRGGDAGEMDGDSASHQTAYPIHEVHVDAFWMDETEVTNRQFREFVEATGYVTFAERPLPAERVKELEEATRQNLARLELMANHTEGKEREEVLAAIERVKEAAKGGELAGSMIFATPKGELYDPNDTSQWWRIVPTASWRNPGGTGTTVEGLEDHPVVNVTYEDAAAYAEWAGKRLPTEAEWEKAARGGLDRQPFVWGDRMFPEGETKWMANIWQGQWPQENTEEDGWFTTAPVKQFPPNPYGLYDVSGNVWEIVSDLYHPRAYTLPSATNPNPTGPTRDEIGSPDAGSLDAATTDRVTKGGSFLCSDVWCKGYQPGSRDQIDSESPANHTGFRCAMDAAGPASE